MPGLPASSELQFHAGRRSGSNLAALLAKHALPVLGVQSHEERLGDRGWAVGCSEGYEFGIRFLNQLRSRLPELNATFCDL